MKLVKLFNKLSAVALAASLVVGFASCSTTTDDPFNPNAPLTLEEYVKSEIKKAIENGGAQAKPEDPSELEFEARTSLMDKIQLNNEKTEDAWGNGTKISSANPLQASEGYGWDKENGQISLPFAYDAGYFGENTHIIIEADDSALNYNADAAIKIEFKVENPSTKHSNEMNITSKFKDGVAIIPISEIGFTDSCQFLLTFRAKGTVTIKNIDMAKAKGQSAPEPTPGEEQKPGKPSGSGSLKEPKSLEFHVNANSTNAENTMIFVKYDRSAYGAEEEVKVTDAELNLYINDVKVKTYNEIVFALDEYGAEITSRGGPIEDPKARKEYKAKLSVGKAVTSGETVKIELVKASVVKVGAASDKITLANLQFALIDTDESVKYYKELAPNAEQFQNICTLEDLTTGEDTESKPEPTPTPGEEEKPGEKPEPGKIPGEEYEAGNSTVTSIKLVKNEYAAGGALQTQIKIPSELTSLLVGDKVKVAFKGTADREIGNVELMIVDTTKTANYWTALSETKKDTFSTEINFEFVFEITKAPIGTGADSIVFAINGLDSDEAATITCTSFSIEKNADKKPAGGENPEPGEKPENTNLLSAEADFPDWGQNTINITSDKFASLERGDKFTIKCKRSNHVDADYHKIEFMITGQKSVEFALGEEEGEQTLISGPLFTVQVDSIKANGVTIQGYKATIASVVITKGDGKEPADPGLLTSEFDINTYDANTSVGKENFTGDVVKALKFSYVIGSVNDGTSKLTLWVGDWQSKYKDGECTGGESLHDGNYNLETPTEEIQYFIYTPTEDEWANLKAQGMAIQGYAVKLIKLELVDNN